MDPITTLSARLGEHLRRFNAQVTTAESCTGGGIAEAITRIPGSDHRAWLPLPAGSVGAFIARFI